MSFLLLSCWIEFTLPATAAPQENCRPQVQGKVCLRGLTKWKKEGYAWTAAGNSKKASRNVAITYLLDPFSNLKMIG